jgi:DNA repair exonuclease SbcCD ATPase subunit
MLNFRYVRYKNFLSAGNDFTELQLDRSPTTLIIGENGSGKSTMLDALCFGLFGKPFRKINKPQLANSITKKNCVVEVEFDVGPNEYKIVRGIKPAIFQVFCNDNMLDQDAAIRDTQEYLEKIILKLNYVSFTQIVILGSSTFVPFMQLPAQRRREVIEDLLDIKIFTLMNMILKNNIQQNKEIINDIKHKLQLENEKRKFIETQIDKLNRRRIEKESNLEGQARDTKSELERQNDRLLGITDDMRALMATIGDDTFDAEIAKSEHSIAQLRSGCKKEREMISFYENNITCPTCKTEMDEGFRDKQTHYHKEGIITNEEDMLKLAEHKGALQTQNDKLKAILAEHAELINQSQNISIDISTLKNKLDWINTQITETEDDGDTTELIDQINACKDKLRKIMDLREKAVDKRELLYAASELLKDKGIKTQIVKQYIPIMNKLINKYLAQMEFFVDFELDENFNEIIRSRHRDEFSYASFSEGEKSRLDLALMLTWRAIAKMKNSAYTNLLILDEVFDGSLDNVGLESLTSILEDMQSSNIFVISHKGELLQDKMRSTIRFEKVKNFSRIAA